MELQIVGCEVLQEQRSQVAGGSPVFMKKLPRTLPGLGSGDEAISCLLTSQQRRAKDDTVKEGWGMRQSWKEP